MNHVWKYLLVGLAAFLLATIALPSASALPAPDNVRIIDRLDSSQALSVDVNGQIGINNFPHVQDVSIIEPAFDPDSVLSINKRACGTIGTIPLLQVPNDQFFVPTYMSVSYLGNLNPKIIIAVGDPVTGLGPYLLVKHFTDSPNVDWNQPPAIVLDPASQIFMNVPSTIGEPYDACMYISIWGVLVPIIP